MRTSTFLVAFGLVLMGHAFMISIQSDGMGTLVMEEWHGLLYTVIFDVAAFLILTTVAATLILTGKDA